MKPNDLSPLYNLTGPSNVNINGLEMAQNLIAPAAWCLAILKHKPTMVIEIGTSKGGLSSLISGCIKEIGSEFHTFDVHSDGDYNQYPLHGNSTFHKMDCFSGQGLEFIKILIQKEGRCFVLCDGGNKPREFNEFSKYLKSGDVIACHDWCDESIKNYSPLYWGWAEVHSDQVGPACKKHSLVKFEPAWFDWSAWFVRQKS